MNQILLLTTSIFSLIFTWLFLKIFIPNISKKLICFPNKRSSHNIPTPQGGGIAFLLIGLISSFFSVNYLYTLACIPIGFVGLIDDFYKLNPLIRYVVQFITVIYLLIIIGIPDFSFLFNIKLLFYLSIFFLLIFFTGIINFINFMDGIDGLIALNFIIFLLVSSLNVSLSYLPLVASLIGFLFWNWEPAKIFMGDVGSTFLGAITISIILQKNNLTDSFFLLLVLTPLLGDAFFCFIRRLLSGQNIFQPHKLHLYQRLHQVGWSHSRVSSLYAIGSLLLSILFLLTSYKLLFIVAILELMYGFYLDKKIAIPFNYN